MSYFVTFCQKRALPNITYTMSISGIFLLVKVGGDFNEFSRVGKILVWPIIYLVNNH